MKLENRDEMEEMGMRELRYAHNHPEDEGAREAYRRGMGMIEQARKSEETEMNAENQAERLQVEREKIEGQKECEEKKQKISWKRATFELAKVSIPVLITVLINGMIHRKDMKDAAYMEENGKWPTTDTMRMARNNGPKLKF